MRRYQEVADNGATDMPDPICASLKGKTCWECPVWGVAPGCGAAADDGAMVTRMRKDGTEYAARPVVDFVHCSEYMPPRPQMVEDDERGVRVPMGGKREGENMRVSRAWGWDVVSWLEAMKKDVLQ